MAGLKPRSALTLEPRNLPEGWEMHKDKQGRSYYANKELLLERCDMMNFFGMGVGSPCEGCEGREVTILWH